MAEAIVLSVMLFSGAICFIAVLVAWNGKEWIQTHWNGKAEAFRQEQPVAEARAREAEAKLALARLDVNRT